MRLQAFRCTVPRGSATGCAVTTKDALNISESPQHCSRLVREFLRKSKILKIVHSPKDPPYLNAVEECWRQGKRRLLVSEYYWTFSDMCIVRAKKIRSFSKKNIPKIKHGNDL